MKFKNKTFILGNIFCIRRHIMTPKHMGGLLRACESRIYELRTKKVDEYLGYINPKIRDHIITLDNILVKIDRHTSGLSISKTSDSMVKISNNSLRVIRPIGRYCYREYRSFKSHRRNVYNR